MSRDADPADRLTRRLSEFVHQAAGLWEQYLAAGPGNVDRRLFDQVEVAANRLTNTLESCLDNCDDLPPLDRDAWKELTDAKEKVVQLAKRCACWPQGLSFITGEAGLVPNVKQHDEFERNLACLHSQLDFYQQYDRMKES